MKRGPLRLLLAAACLCLATLAQAVTPIEIASTIERIPAWQALRIVASADRHLGPEQAAILATGNDAITVDSPDRVLGRGTRPYWALFSVHNPEAIGQMRLLAVETTTQADIRLFRRDAGGAWHPAASLADGAAGRLGGGTTHPAWALRLPPHQGAVDLLLRIEGPAVVRFPVYIYHSASFAERERKLHVAVGLALASCVLVGLFIVSLRRHLDDASVPLFICMLIADLVGALWLSGFFSELFPGATESTLSPIGFAAYAILFGCGSLHARVYLNTAAWAPGIDRLLLGLGGLWLTLAPWFAAMFPLGARVLLVWGGTAIALTLVTVALLAARRRVPFSGFVAAAWLTYLLVGSSFLLARIIDNPVLWSSSALALMQATAIAVLFGFAMKQRLARQRDTLVAARQDAESRQERTAELMRERGLLFAATNHDLRQPLMGVSLFADLLKSATTQAEREEYARKLDLALKEVDGTLVGIQQLAAIHEAAHSPKLETVGLDELLAPMIEEYRGRSVHKRITLRYQPSRVSITTHVPYFQRIVRNVLANAIRYTDHGDRILVGCRHGGGLRLVIADTGQGMTEAQTRQAFDAFHRFDAKMPTADGFGLGLFSTKSLADVLGITVSLRSAKGRGTEFQIFLAPIQEQPMHRAPAVARPPASISTLGSDAACDSC